ncbi:hypothetical protein MKK88_30845 [Methylobacterium sp. E-005]|uniref:hypothetical protein n=1 Tax=Methylobacterium sp. E-005 TaxID=2836549 RepID=UPI001FBBF956|nr:hypothetical protein [Methylobacterium sp. E-005]MCJ2090351.1 hypothetical protein [Methylobacterium sp. E-005]
MERLIADLSTAAIPPHFADASPPILTVDGLLAALAAARAAGDADLSRSLVDLGSQWAMDADLDEEFAHQGIYWDAPDHEEVARADALAKTAKADLALLLTDLAIEAQYQEELQSLHYLEMRAERLPTLTLSDDDEYA